VKTEISLALQFHLTENAVRVNFKAQPVIVIYEKIDIYCDNYT
jgi:hypothetical protein